MSKFVSPKRQGSSFLLPLQNIINSVSIATIATVTAINIFLIFRLLKITQNQETKEFLQNSIEADINSTPQDKEGSPPLQPTTQSKKTRRWPEIITAASTVILAAVTAIYVILTFNLVKTMQNQVELTQEPVLSVEPEKMASGEIANFALGIKNHGITSVSDIEIYEDYFVAHKPPDEPLMLYRFGWVNIFPDTTISHLEPGEEVEIPIEFSETYSQMTEFYLSDEKGAKTMVLRLILRFRRALDGREFEISKVYLIAADGSVLIDDSARQLDIDYPKLLSLEEIKSVLGIK